MASSFIAAIADSRDRGNGLNIWLNLYLYPAVLLLHSFGAGASAAFRYDNLGVALRQPVVGSGGRWATAATELHIAGALDPNAATALSDMERRRTPGSDWVCQVLRPVLSPLVASDRFYERDFDRFEILLGLVFAGSHPRGAAWAPIGRFTWRGEQTGDLVGEMLTDIQRQAVDSPLVGTLFDTADDLATAAARFGRSSDETPVTRPRSAASPQ